MAEVRKGSLSAWLRTEQGQDHCRLLGVDPALGQLFTTAPVGIGVEHLLADELAVMVGRRSPAWNLPELGEADHLALSHVHSLPWPTEANHLDQVLARDHRARSIRLVAPSHAVAADIASATDLALTLPGRVVRRLCRGRADLRTFPCPFSGAGHVSLEWAMDRAKTGRARFLRRLLTEAIDRAVEGDHSDAAA